MIGRFSTDRPMTTRLARAGKSRSAFSRRASASASEVKRAAVAF
jgi:hypothetical protein